MRLRPPAVPLIAVDPYFSVWSPADRLTDKTTCHWTGRPNTMLGTVCIDDTSYCFMGDAADAGLPALIQTGLEVGALSTAYTFEGAGIRLCAVFTTPVIADDLTLLSRPVSYLRLEASSLDGARHTVTAAVRVSEEICLDRRGQLPVETAQLDIGGIPAARIGSAEQPVLGRCGDDVRIDWGYFYLAVRGGRVGTCEADGMTWLRAEAALEKEAALFAFAYDDIRSILYFGEQLPAYWKADGTTIEQAIQAAFAEYDALLPRCEAFDQSLREKAAAAGGERYAELLSLAYRQVVAAHKLVVDGSGELLYISKECFSNACAATVDVSYPSIPFFLYYNPELIKGMLRPIFRYAKGGVWPFDFAPHDAGCYPHVNGQVYSGGVDPTYQMPVEECGNVLLMLTALAAAEGTADFAMIERPLLQKWVRFLVENGQDPDNQLCTDDFAGHLAHNCNLSLKAIMGIAGFGRLLEMAGERDEASSYTAIARRMAQSWLKNAANGDGSYRLAFDQPGTFSMKYNVVWDRLLGLDIFPEDAFALECASYRGHIGRYGLPLDNRSDCTKSDWLVWIATLAGGREVFASFIEPLWRAYHESPVRVPMTDLYSTATAEQIVFGEGRIGFQHRSVQGGLYLKLLADSQKLNESSGNRVREKNSQKKRRDFAQWY